MQLPPSIVAALEVLADVPGVGARSAERLLFQLLRSEGLLDRLIGRLSELNEQMGLCPICGNWYQKADPACSICQDPKRDASLLCIVESPFVLWSMERTERFNGRYQVLHGLLSPTARIFPEDLRCQAIENHLAEHPEIKEVIIALSPHQEGDTTTIYLCEQIKKIRPDIKLSHLARGLPHGTTLDYVDLSTLGRALADRQSWDREE